jgi:hypothetical protein
VEFNLKYLVRDVFSVYFITFIANVILTIYYNGKAPIKSFALTNIFCIVLSFLFVGLLNRELKVSYIIQVITSCWFISILNVIFFNMAWKMWFISIIPLIILSSLGILLSRALLPNKYKIY